jgi:hypothetical protein
MCVLPPIHKYLETGSSDEPSRAVVEFLKIQVYCLGCAGGFEKAIEKILSLRRPHHHRVAGYVIFFLNLFIFLGLLRFVQLFYI